MAKTSRQTAIFGVEDWKKIYQTYREADFQSYDFETLRKVFVDYLRTYYPEQFNDYVESSEFIAMLDVMAFMGQALAFRGDLNARENFIETAERRDSVVKLAELVSYTPKRNDAARGYLKVFSISTTENVIDYNGNNLANATIDWDDATNPDWYEQFVAIMNAALVDSQRVGRPGESKNVLGIQTDEYSVNTLQNTLPVLPFRTTVDSVSMIFEAVSATTKGSTQVYEPAPRPNSVFNVLYRNDKLGFGSPNTGFFMYFKQGVLQTQDFLFNERIANRVVDVTVEGINNSDIWLYKLTDQGNIESEWTRVEGILGSGPTQVDPEDRKYFEVSSRANDQISIAFGDGVFSEIPTGRMRAYVRSSNGLQYVINPDEMQSITFRLSYVSRTGRVETLTFTCGLTVPVSNAQGRESIQDIKNRAPARFYTQNRMVNGEDYTNFPYTKYGSIIKSKAVNRTSIGTSRYLDLVDVTGKYSSTNVFASDGLFYELTEAPSFTFVWNDLNDIADVIINQVEPIVKTRALTHFYYKKDNFPRPNLDNLNLKWVQRTTLINETTGFFESPTGAIQAIGRFTTDLRKFLTQSALVEFKAPAGMYFDDTNNLRPGPNNGKTIWATITDIVLDGANLGQTIPEGEAGPVTVNNFVPTGAIPTSVIPLFETDFNPSLEQEMTEQISLYRNFGLGYDSFRGEWYVITSNNLAIDAPFSTANAQANDGIPHDASWLIQFTTDGSIYTVKNRTLEYLFSSVLETRFFFDGGQQIYDSKTGTVINDYIRILKTNSSANDEKLREDLYVDIVGQPVESDGFADDYRVSVSFTDFDLDGVADDPDFFEKIVGPNSKVFLQKQIDSNNLLRYVPLAEKDVVTIYNTKDEIELVKFQYPNGAIFYAKSDALFYALSVQPSGVRSLVTRDDFLALTGRGGLHFHYRHNSAESRRIDPGTTNIIDIYVVTNSYYSAYRNYVKDSTNTVKEPLKPTLQELTETYGDLQKYKMVSDNVIVNPVTFKPLFGSKAPRELQASLKVIKYNTNIVSDSEIKSRVVEVINEFFDIEKWDFGQTFYFSELSAFIHRRIGDIVGSIVLVPKDPKKVFGDLFEIRSAPNEIFVSAVTVNEIEVVDALTAGNLKLSVNGNT